MPWHTVCHRHFDVSWALLENRWFELSWRTVAVNSPNTSERPHAESLPLLHIEPDRWRAILNVLRLSRQQAKILDLLLRGMCEESIAPVVGIRQSTLRADIGRILARTRSNNRTELAMQVRALSHQVKSTEAEAVFYGKRLF
jgi:DNA-binding NarL/FixJ family response regulator